MDSRASRPSAVVALAGCGALLVTGAFACGTSIQAIYEGDVRFEHCMALDSRPDVKPTIRRACWEEWEKFYTYGQTRDRVEYARVRFRHLSGASDFSDEGWPDEVAAARAVPEPTSVLAPPPMTLAADAGAPRPDASAAAPAAAPVEERKPPSADCTGGCEESWAACKQGCKTPTCEKACAGKYRGCMRRCF